MMKDEKEVEERKRRGRRTGKRMRMRRKKAYHKGNFSLGCKLVLGPKIMVFKKCCPYTSEIIFLTMNLLFYF